jgi:hypothetical protein
MTIRRSLVAALIAYATVFVGSRIGDALGQTTPPAACVTASLPVVVNLDDVKHANLIAHERAAIDNGQPRTVTLERDNAAARRVYDVRGIPTRPGFDRDEWPPAFTEEAGHHTDGRPPDDVAYVPSSENRSGGAVMGAALRPYCDGQRFIVEAGRP